jgi:formate dehydrogenase alpha subunit
MAEKETVTLRVDGIEVSIEKGKKVYDACVAAGVYLPGLCYDPKLTRFGGCRMCIVDVVSRGRGRAKWACCEPAANGTEIVTDSPKIQKKRQIMMEFLLMYHPLDCPTCNASGDCGLQDAAFYVKQKKGRMPHKRRNEPLLIDNPVLERDFNKCILCGKCVIICDEVQGNNAIDFQDRGFWAEVGTPFRIPLNCDFCGQCLSVCPTGSFQDHTEKYKGHDWEYEKTATTCPHCGVGCTLVANTKNGGITKITADDLVGVNNGNLCGRGHFGHEAHRADERLRTPLIRDGVKLIPASWEAAVDTAVEKIKEVVATHGAGSVAVIAGEQLTNEDAYLLQRLARGGVGTTRIETLSNMRAPALNADLFDLFGGSAPIGSYDAVREAGSYLFFGADPEKENPVVANMIRVAMRDNKTQLFVANARNTLFNPIEAVHARYAYGTETSLLKALIAAVGGSVAADVLKPTGVDETTVRKIADGLKGAAPMIVLGSEIHDHPRGAEIVKGAVSLAAATGGKALLFREYANTQGTNDMGLSSGRLPGYLKADDANGAAHYRPVWETDLKVFPAEDHDLFRALADGKIKGLIIAGADPVSFHPDTQFVREAIQEAAFTLVTSSFPTETTLLADVVLPAATAAERDGTFTNNEGRIQAVRAAIEPLGEAKAEWEMFAELGARFGLKNEFTSVGAVTAEIAKAVPGYDAATPEAVEAGEAMAVYAGATDGVKAIPFTAEPIKIPEAGSFPYLAHFGNSLYHLGTLTRKSVALNKIASRAYVEMGMEDAGKAGLADGDDVVVESKQGAINARLVVDDRSPAGSVFVAKNFENEPALRLVYRNDEVTKVKVTKAGA